MASVTDIHNFDEQFSQQLDKLAEADIDERDRQAIREFIQCQDTQRGLAASTNVNSCSALRLSAERGDTPLMEMNRSDVDALLFEYKHEYEMAKGTLRNYRKALRKFFRYHDREWAEDIKVGAVADREVDTDKTLTEDEIDALRKSADHPRNKALLEILLDTGLRISAVGTLRVQDVELGGRAGTVTLNQEAVGRKGASGKRPLTYSKPYVANWLDVHPRGGDPDAIGTDEDDKELFMRRAGDVGFDPAPRREITPSRWLSLARCSRLRCECCQAPRVRANANASQANSLVCRVRCCG